MDIAKLSLVVAALAVFVGPIVSWLVARHQTSASAVQTRQQLAASLVVAHSQIVAPMRQAWINSLRDLLAELLSSMLHYYLAGFEDRSDAEYQKLQMLEHKLRLMLNVNEADHLKLQVSVGDMVISLETEPGFSATFLEHHDSAMKLSQAILKREWDRVKEPAALPAGA